jgi:sugar O-acyltransferase (sialic acid O-acetyltransferase NeuD family)
MSKMIDVLYGIYGASGCGRSLMPVAREQLVGLGTSERDLVFIDDARTTATVNGQEAMSLSGFLSTPARERKVVIAVADGTIRAKLAHKLQSNNVGFFSIQHPICVVMDNVQIGEGSCLSPFVTVASNSCIGKHFHANLYSFVEHDCIIGDYVTFAPGVKCNGNVIIEDYAYIGSGAVIRQGTSSAPLVIGNGAIVGMGAVVTKSVAAGTVVVGNPARIMEKN